jgi:protein sidekick
LKSNPPLCLHIDSRRLFFIAVPQAQYKWLKDGEPLSDFKDAVVYKIFNAARNDSGSYQCLAQNIAGTIFSEKSEVVVACK